VGRPLAVPALPQPRPHVLGRLAVHLRQLDPRRQDDGAGALRRRDEAGRADRHLR
jgi:hypothetical protein